MRAVSNSVIKSGDALGDKTNDIDGGAALASLE